MVTDAWDNSLAAQAQFALSNGGLTATNYAGAQNQTIIGQAHHPTGKWYFEMTVTGFPADTSWGIATNAQPNIGVLWNTGVGVRGILNCWMLNGTQYPTGGPNPSSEIIGIAVDIDNKLIWYRETSIPGTWYGNNGTGDPVLGTNGFSWAAAPGAGSAMYIAYTSSAFFTSQAATMNSGGSSFAATLPTGYTAWQNYTVSGPFGQVAQVARETLWAGNPAALIPQVAREVLRSRPTGISIALQTDMAEVWFMPGVFIDFTQSANRALFHDSMNQAIYLGGNGQFPTSSNPLIYLTIAHGDPNAFDFVNNAAGSGAMTVITTDNRGGGYGIAPTNP